LSDNNVGDLLIRIFFDFFHFDYPRFIYWFTDSLTCLETPV
jgi:hypothetical protein